MTDAVMEVTYARFGRRLLAIVIDMAFYAATSAALLFLLYGVEYFAWVREPHGMFEFYGVGDIFAQYLLPFLLTIVLWCSFGATPGKFLLGCQMVDARTLQRVTIRQAVLRYIGYLLSALPLGAGFLWVLVDKKRQGFHDKLARTVVIVEDETRKSLRQLEREAT